MPRRHLRAETGTLAREGAPDFREPGGEGFRAASDAPIPAATTFDSGWSLFNTVLFGYDPTQTWHAVMARGSRRGPTTPT